MVPVFRDFGHTSQSTMAEKIEEKTYNGHKVVGVVLRSKAKTLHFLRHAEGRCDHVINQQTKQAAGGTAGTPRRHVPRSSPHCHGRRG